MTRWDPAQYLEFGNERTRPFIDLLARVPVDAQTVADLGCGPGNDVPPLRRRWPDARIVGVDSSPEMIERARAVEPGVEFEIGDVATWDGSADVVVTNATLQWVPGHRALLPRLADSASKAFAFQVPGNHISPSHVLMREIGAEFGVRDVRPLEVATAGEYLADLARPGWDVDAWETTYCHVLRGEDPVFEWVSGTGARPYLQALSDADRPDFVARYKAALRDAYPKTEIGGAPATVLPFRRVFAVATRHGVARLSAGAGGHPQ
ncbi:methyltransferase domain-containing protein [Tsukamurella sp. 8F]|uniref:methyltransferase domain-containing protein n=1 Tax=unclassified Tsukamurella TaxID=2633480 RepID=UPI0023B98E70|nr:MULTISPECIES: methyltransferase domain-containing protein [unclassified Tsukamurella]MDF0531694.1 methyltransferase domain-containing protein [Tsukamurella sp. 8J]MDF0588940.1 methyltransferase domain-containing protein [Tsukamurella sp. 8F]